MYSYQHRYHAGCFADLHKHLILIAILEHLGQKSTPFCVLDAFAGEGLYDLTCEESQKVKEYEEGFGRILNLLNPPPLIKKLLEISSLYKSFDHDLIYPGSPALIAQALRAQDSAIFIENHPQAFAELKKHFGRSVQVHLHKRDAFEGLNALIPFKEKRGLIFIDPSFEVKEEYQTIANLVSKLVQKFPTGIYFIWYPILKEGYHHKLIASLKTIHSEKSLSSEWLVPRKEQRPGMLGSGVYVINSPWKLEEHNFHQYSLLLRKE